MPRTKQNKADVEALQRLVVAMEGVIDYNPLIAAVMRSYGSTYAEIAEALGVHRSTAEYYVKSIERVLYP